MLWTGFDVCWFKKAFPVYAIPTTRAEAILEVDLTIIAKVFFALKISSKIMFGWCYFPRWIESVRFNSQLWAHVCGS